MFLHGCTVIGKIVQVFNEATSFRLLFHVNVFCICLKSNLQVKTTKTNNRRFIIMLFLWHLLQDFIKVLFQSKQYIPLIADTNWFAGNQIR